MTGVVLVWCDLVLCFGDFFANDYQTLYRVFPKTVNEKMNKNNRAKKITKTVFCEYLKTVNNTIGIKLDTVSDL